MWSALRSDLSEFVSTVKEDTTNVLNRIDHDFDQVEMSPEEREAHRRRNLQETFTSPLPVEPDDDAADEEQVAQVFEFLKTFQIDDKTDEIAELLEQYPDTLKKQFENLVPTEVTYEEFWQRYFYRCDVERITQEWNSDNDGEEDEEEDIPNPINALGSLFGGAVKAVSSRMAEDDTGEPIPPGTATSATSTAAALFQASGGRPPFVMNTAVDESVEDEEEELGWGDEDDFSDDDEEDEDNGDDEEDGDVEESMEQIEFKDEATERLQEQLKQALEERDQLHQTVELQTKEIAALKQAGNVVSEREEMERLKMEVFEKDSELAALKASQLDISHVHNETSSAEQICALEEKIGALSKELGDKTSELSEMESAVNEHKTKVAVLEDKLSALAGGEGSRDSVISELEATVERYKNNAAELEKNIASLTEDNTAVATMQSELRDCKQRNTDLEAKIASLEEAESTSKSTITKMRSTLEAYTKESANSETQIDSLTSELANKTSCLSQLEAIVTEYKQSCAELGSKVAILTEDCQAKSASISEMESIIESHKAKVSELENTIKRLSSENETLHNRIKTVGERTNQAEEASEPAPPVVASSGEKAPSRAEKLAATADDDDWGDDWGDDDDL